MASSKLAWKDYTIAFVSSPSKDYECSICLSILRDPYLTTCCGSHFCKACVEGVKRGDNQCPLCREQPINAFVDKYFKRQLNQFKIYCPRRNVKGHRGGEVGCRWKGQLGGLEQHLAIDQLEGECQYVEVKCQFCRQPVLRRNLNTHVSNTCPNRKISCDYCDFQSTYEEVTKKHVHSCPNYPLLCPNSCSSNVIQRHKMADHLSKCLEQEVVCSFSEMGCSEKIRRKQLSEHLETNVMHHQMLTCKAFYAQQQSLLETQLKVVEIQQQHALEISALKDKLSKAEFWVGGFEMMAEEVKRNNWPLYLSIMNKLIIGMSQPIAPIIISVPYSQYGYTHSMPFYTHLNGYKMLLSISNANTYGYCSQTSVTVSFCIVKSEHDDILDWPRKCKTTIALLNHLQDKGHEEKVYNINAHRYNEHDFPTSNPGDDIYYEDHRNCSDEKGSQPTFPGHEKCKPVRSSRSLTFTLSDQNYTSGQDLYFKVTFKL
ncbi:TNF receptor-associated factor 6-like [Dysidea avara]|uniref:TNF receptor-associated factor 6-like n=1 Tax=Dysidea avara TaxID=196820 RepID=UPI003329D17D